MNPPAASDAPASSTRMDRLARAAAAISMLPGIAVLAGWVLGISWLRSGFSNGAAINPASALLFVLAGLSLWTLAAPGAPSLFKRKFGLVAATIVVALAALILAGPLLGFPPRLDLVLVSGRVAALGAAAPRPLSSGTAILFLMVGASLLLVRRRGEIWRLAGRSIGFLILTLGLLGLVTVVVRALGNRAGGGSSGFGMLIGLVALALGLASAGSRKPERHEVHEPGTMGGRVSAVVTVAVMMLTLTCGLWIWSTLRMLSADARQREGLVRRAQLGAIVSSLQLAESGQHRYLLTEDPRFLEYYTTSIERIPQVIDSARRDTTQARRVAVLEPLVAERLALMARNIRLSDSGRARDARTLVQSGRGLQLMREIQNTMATMVEEEDSLAASWSSAVQTATRVSLVTSFFAGLLAISFLILAGRALSRDFKNRARIEAERDRFFTLSIDMLCIAAGDGYFKRLNPAFTKTLGWSVEELTSRPFLDFVHPDDREATLQEVHRQMERGESVLRFENRYMHKDGSWRVLSWRSAPQPGGVMFATARDVTDAQMAQAALQSAKEAADLANRAKSDFLAKMSHELRTPLNSIIGFSEILESDGVGPLNDKQKRYIANVLLSGRNLLQLINDILDLSKVEAGRMELMLEPFEVGDALAGAREMVTPLAAKKHLTLELTLLRETLPVQADQAKVKQVMYNLLSNAIKFTPEGGRIGVTARLLPAAGNGNGDRLVEIAVSDTGIGIAPEYLECIFVEFEQVGFEARQNHQGTGLGLALTRKLIELHGGKIWVESDPGKGSTFRFTLPSAPGAISHTAEQRAAPKLASGRPAPLVLVVDDDASSRDLITHYLEQNGYRATCTATAMEAVRLARELKPDAITLDLILPDRDGLLVLAQLKTDPETRRIPVVVVSVTERSELGFSLGAEEWLVKPVQKEAFVRALDTATSTSPSDKRTILVVDDDVTAIEYLSELVHQRGCDVLCASNGREGVALALRHLPDAIILDLSMPEMNGFEAVKALRENSRTRNTPILIVTAMDLTLAERQRLQTSVQGIVSKGWQVELLTELARLCLPAEVVS